MSRQPGGTHFLCRGIGIAIEFEITGVFRRSTEFYLESHQMFVAEYRNGYGVTNVMLP